MKVELQRPSLVRTRKALEEYDASQMHRDSLLENIETDEDVKKWNQVEKESLDRVRVAFYEDTKDRNSKSNCMLLDLPTLRGWAKRFL
jgi:hypothetical protein